MWNEPSCLTPNCCSTDSDRPHRCCHLPNNFDSQRILPILYNAPGDALPAKKIAPSLGILGLQPNTRSVPWPLPSPYTSGTSIDRFSRFVGLTFVTQTHADLATSATIGRILIPGYEALRRNNNKKKNNKILSQLLLTAGRAALDRRLLPAGATTANPPHAAAAGKREGCVTDTHRTVTSRGSMLGSGGTRPQIVARPQV